MLNIFVVIMGFRIIPSKGVGLHALEQEFNRFYAQADTEASND
jgi:hypothetical protein